MLITIIIIIRLFQNINLKSKISLKILKTIHLKYYHHKKLNYKLSYKNHTIIYIYKLLQINNHNYYNNIYIYYNNIIIIVLTFLFIAPFRMLTFIHMC